MILLADLVQSIKTAALEAIEAEKPCDAIFGTVTSASPLNITVDQKLVLSEAQLILTRHVTEYEIDMTVEHETEVVIETIGDAPIPFDAIDVSHGHYYGGSTKDSSEEKTGWEEEHDHEMPHTHEYENTTFTTDVVLNLEHDHEYKGRKTFLVHNALTVGEKVLLIRAKGGQKFIVVDRLRL